MVGDDKPETLKKPEPRVKAIAVERSESSAVPVITARGHGKNAEKILDIAFAAGVKVRQDPDLTELLDQFEVDSPIPLDALEAVTQILHYVYNANEQMKPVSSGEEEAADESEPDTIAIEDEHGS